MSRRQFPNGPDHPDNWPSKKTVRSDGLRGILRCQPCGNPKKALWDGENLVGIYCEDCQRRDVEIERHNREVAKILDEEEDKTLNGLLRNLVIWAIIVVAVSAIATACN